MTSSRGAETAARKAGPRDVLTPARDEPCLSVSQAAKALRVSPSTLRRYVADHAEHVDVIRSGRSGRELRIPVRAVPTLAQIRDLRRRRIRKAEINHLLGLAGDGTSGVAALVRTGAGVPAPSADRSILDLLQAMRREVTEVKRERHDSEVVMRQALSSIVFLLDKYNREIQYYISEERIANRERDLDLARHQEEIRRLSERKDGPGRFLLAVVAAACRYLHGALWKGGPRRTASESR